MQRKLVIIIFFALIMVGAMLGLIKWNQNNNNNDEVALIKEVDRKLTADERKIYEDRLADVEKRLENPKDDSEKTELLRYKAIQLQGLGKLAEAQKILLDAIELSPQSYNLFISIHTIYLEMGDFESARNAIIKATVLDPLRPDSWIRYIQLEQEKFNSSPDHIKSIFSEALSKTREHIDIAKFYAAFLEEIGDDENAKQYWLKVIDMDPDNKSMYQQEIDRLRKKQ